MKTDPKQVIEVIGISGVIASLLFVGMQLVLDRRVAVGSQYHERMILGHEYYLSLSENEKWISTEAKQWEEGFTPVYWNADIESYKAERKLTTEDIVRQDRLYMTTLLRLNNNYFQYEHGLLEGDVLEGIRTGLKIQMTQSPIFRGVANRFAVGDPGFQALILEVEQELVGEL